MGAQMVKTISEKSKHRKEVQKEYTETLNPKQLESHNVAWTTKPKNPWLECRPLLGSTDKFVYPIPTNRGSSVLKKVSLNSPKNEDREALELECAEFYDNGGEKIIINHCFS